MKKIINILLLLPIVALADLDVSKIGGALSSIQSSKSSKILKFYNNSGLNLKKQLNFTSQNNADIILFPKKHNIHKALVVNSYQALKLNQNSIGAIYMKKGRTQIIFIKERLETQGFNMMNASKKYIVPECQLSALCLLE